MLKGIGVSDGIAFGKVKIKKETECIVEVKEIKDTTDEIGKLDSAILLSEKQIKDLYEKTLNEIGENEAEIFNAHLMILKDEMILGEIKLLIENEKRNVESALEEITHKYIDMFNNIDDPYLRERAADLKDVSSRILKNLMGIEITDFSNLDEDVIVIADDLTPSDTVGLDKKHVLGFITRQGGKNSHSAIMARTLEIPAVVGVNDLFEFVENDTYVIIDGEQGHVIVNPDEQLIKQYADKRNMLLNQKEALKKYVNQETITKDNKKVELVANIGTLADLESVIKNGAEGIGLFRTELFYLDRSSLPSEEEQFQAYKKLASEMKEKPLIIRTLDIGGDKEIPYLNMPTEMNPFLGYRAIRLCLDRQDIFMEQLRAILRASCFGNIKIMFPMISCMQELRQAKSLLESAKKSLSDANIDYNKNIDVGMMIEVPSAAMLSDQLAKEVDFFSIGTNDLIQYTVAVDRGNKKIEHLYSEFNPGVLRLINMVITNAHKEGIWVGMCGEAASNPKLIPLLLAMGLDEFSMNASMITRSRALINNLTYEDTKQVLKVLDYSDFEEIEKCLQEFIQ